MSPGPPDAEPLFVERWGEHGPTVVFLHGIGGSSRYWRGLAAGSDGNRATAPDLLGFGRSPWPESARYDMDDHLGRWSRWSRPAALSSRTAPAPS